MVWPQITSHQEEYCGYRSQIRESQARLSLTILFVAHDLSVVKHISDRVAVMYVGRIAEMTRTEQLFNTPRHPYTEALLSAVPKSDPLLPSKRIALEGEVADPAHPPSGCYFHPRCHYVTETCRKVTPLLQQVAPGHWASCHRAPELDLAGVTMRGGKVPPGA